MFKNLVKTIVMCVEGVVFRNQFLERMHGSVNSTYVDHSAHTRTTNTIFEEERAGD